MAKKVRLHATQESDEANWSGNRYRVNNDREIWVDEEAVAPLVAIGGYVPDPAPLVEVPHGNIRVIHTSDPMALCAHAGREFALESDGSLIVPIEAVEHLAAHGFTPVSEQVSAPVVAPEPVPVAPPAPVVELEPEVHQEAAAKAEPVAEPHPSETSAPIP